MLEQREPPSESSNGPVLMGQRWAARTEWPELTFSWVLTGRNPTRMIRGLQVFDVCCAKPTIMSLTEAAVKRGEYPGNPSNVPISCMGVPFDGALVHIRARTCNPLATGCG